MQNRSRRSVAVSLVPAWVGIILLIGWAMFTYGYLWQSLLDGTATAWGALIMGAAPIGLAAAAFACWRRREQFAGMRRWLERHTDAVDAISEAHIGWWIALAAGLGLYTELMIIRIHGSYFHLFAYFKNVSLMSCFLGLGLGFILGNRRPLTTPLAMPMLAAQIALMYLLRSRGVATGLQNPISEQLTLGMAQAESLAHMVTVYGFVVLVFAFNALCFVPFGQLAARLMLRRDKLEAYAWNLGGSLAGILLFALLSYAWTPPPVWLFVPAAGLAMLLRREPRSLMLSSLAGMAVIAFLSFSFVPHHIDVYSPYQILTLKGNRDSGMKVDVNNIYYQRILNLSDTNTAGRPHLAAWREYYGLPYRFKPSPADVLIVGSGTGNDVAAALRHGAARVDAVEIDPAILKFGRVLHPESPYQNSRVTAHATDARAFIQYTQKKFDLIVYGLLDSHTLLSGNSGVRLDSFVYTVEAFREARSRLKPGGMLCMSFSMVRPEIGRKLYLMLQQAFDGRTPVVYETGYDGGYCYLIGDKMDATAVALPSGCRDVTALCARTGVKADVATDDWPFFYMGVRTYPASYLLLVMVLMGISVVFVQQMTGWRLPGLSRVFNPAGRGFWEDVSRRRSQGAGMWQAAGGALGARWNALELIVEEARHRGEDDDAASQNKSQRKVGSSSRANAKAASANAPANGKGDSVGFSGACFFLGAGFMLVETKGITELALVYGSTWVVICAVITAILVMAFAANALVMRRGAPRTAVAYGMLLGSLALGLLLSRESLTGMGEWPARVAMTVLLTLPLFFSGFVFSSELKAATSIAVALSSNLLGAMLGGFLEYNAMYFGYRSLYVAAMIMYALAWVFTAQPRGNQSDDRSKRQSRGKRADGLHGWWHAIAEGSGIRELTGRSRRPSSRGRSRKAASSKA